MNTIAALAAFGACTALGLWKSRLLKKRLSLLCELRQLAADFSVSMRYTAPTLDELSESCGGEFGLLLRQARQEGLDIKTAWSAAVAGLSSLPHCDKTEAELLSRLGTELGTCAAEGQLSILALYEERMKKLCGEAEQAAQLKGKLFRNVGTLLGAGAAILIL